MSKKIKITQNDLTPKKAADHIQPADKVYDLLHARQKRTILYWNGKPCKNGHTSVRYTKDGVCKECYRLKSKMKEDIQIDREKVKVKLDARKRSVQLMAETGFKVIKK